MAEHQIRFEDGAAYERMMGTWSRLAGEIFLDWLAPRAGLKWIDIGCGSGAFTGLLVERCAPAEVQAIDPSEAQLSFARARPAGLPSRWRPVPRLPRLSASNLARSCLSPSVGRSGASVSWLQPGNAGICNRVKQSPDQRPHCAGYRPTARKVTPCTAA